MTDEKSAMRKLLQEQQQDLLAYRRFVDWLIPRLIKDNPLTRQALGLIDRPVLDVQRRFEALPEVTAPQKEEEEDDVST